MTPRDARLVLGWIVGTTVEQALLTIVRHGTWSDLERVAVGWPGLVDAYLLLADHRDRVEAMARRG